MHPLILMISLRWLMWIVFSPPPPKTPFSKRKKEKGQPNHPVVLFYLLLVSFDRDYHS